MTAVTTRIDLPDVTLVAVSDVALAGTVRALDRSMQDIDFAAVRILSSREPPSLPIGMSWERIAPIASKQAYSKFMLHDLWQWVDTSHALCVQWDGFVLNAAGWDPSFLDYDYIGSPWPHFADGHQVGNGGFSLRSRRLLYACRSLQADGSEAEDVTICRTYRARLEQEGLCFAPVTVASNFAYERTPPNGGEFGFHGIFNLIRLMTKSEAVDLLRSTDRSLIARTEVYEMLIWAIRKGDIRMARALLRRLAR